MNFFYFRINDAEITKSGVKITPPKKKYVMKYNDSSFFFFLGYPLNFVLVFSFMKFWF
jgi:hypothetical protein